MRVSGYRVINGRKVFSNLPLLAVWTGAFALYAVVSVPVLFERKEYHELVWAGLGGVVMWVIGIGLFSRNQWFVSEKTFGYEDAFRREEVSDEEIVSARISGLRAPHLILDCRNRQVVFYIDPISNPDWWDEVRARLGPKLQAADSNGNGVGGGSGGAKK
ncbi:MAG: hypothetical protein JO317_07740, partial [Verrucomicrobiae bacterium]|nr:hypothetical protein [Verrucomicrobiae bacterium]